MCFFSSLLFSLFDYQNSAFCWPRFFNILKFNPMTLTEIKAAIEEGKKVFWSNENYQVIKDDKGQFLVQSQSNGHCVGLTWKDRERMSFDETDFFKK